MAMNFDFMGAKLKHMQWKLKLRDFLNGKEGLSAEQATNHRDCDLGKWLYGVGMVKYSQIPDIKRLESEHKELHRAVKRVIELKSSGQTAKAESAFASIDEISQRLVGLLTQVDEEVRKRG
jgi:hypothetical protein